MSSLVNDSWVSVVLISKVEHYIDILYLYTVPTSREKGLALYLLLEVEKFYFSQSASYIFSLEVYKGNHSAINLYKKFGMKVVDIRKSYYSKSRDALVLSKEFSLPTSDLK